MAEIALDLSKPVGGVPVKPMGDAPTKTEPMQDMCAISGSSDSGRASTGSASSSICSDGGSEHEERESRVKPVSGPIPSSHMNKHEMSPSDYDASVKSETSPVTRPFKMYPMDVFPMYSSPLLAGAAGVGPGGLCSPMGSVSSMYDSPSAMSSLALTPLTSHLLQRKRRAENREIIENDPKRMTPVSEQSKDTAYWERRRKNNEAAKRSRDSRRQKEEEIAMRAAFLEQENLKLRAQVAILKNETAKLHYMLYNRI
ncbi:uncharacterized protein LOC121370146 [Gigantopelta aegis]|uniref:uncharacterized protein LOC121370146 n=1 Tax=Gigantopelta aegis TaxID=1735272 RepID=UPI001B88C8A0|nr:uncharacterized protein LOC121370146 [Gigantopelta aegis]